METPPPDQEDPENPSPGQEDPENPPRFWCHICKVGCSSTITLQSHFLGAKHKRAEEALQEDREGEAEDQTRPQESLQHQLNACQEAEPALGLQYIYEYKSHGYYRYECCLCNCFLGGAHMFTHIMGNRHRIQYLAAHHPSLGINNTSVLNKRGKKLKKLREVCMKVEEEYGRKQINVAKEDDKMCASGDPVSLPPPPRVCYQPEVMDFASDDFLDVKKELAVEEEVVTFLKLKAEYEASQRKEEIARERRLLLAAGGPARDPGGDPDQGQAGGPEQGQAGGRNQGQAEGPEQGWAVGPEQGQAGKPNQGQAGRPDQDQAENKENEPYDSDADDPERKPELDAFSGPKDVFQYLESFEVFELQHIHYLMKVTEKLKKVLDRHKKKLESTTDSQYGSNNQPSLTDQETSTLHQDQQGHVAPPDVSDPQLEYEEEPYREPTMESDQALELSPNQQGKNNPSAFLELHSRNSNKKLSFRISGTPGENKSMVPSELLSNMQYKFAVKSKKMRMMEASGTCTNDENLRDNPTSSVQSAMDKTGDAQEQRFPNEGPTMVKPTPAAYPHELLGNSAGSVSTWASAFNSGSDSTREVEEQRFSSSRLGNPGMSMVQPRHPMSSQPDRAGGASRGPLPNEGPSVVSPPYERFGNAADSVPHQASNEHFKTAGGFPPPSAQNAQERLRNLAPPQEQMRTFAGSAPNRAWDEPFKNVDGFPPPNTQEPMSNLAPLYPPREPIRTPAGSLPIRASKESVRNAGGFPPFSAPNTQEPIRASGSVPNWASNEPFKNAGSFPPPPAQNTQERMRNSAPLYPPQEPLMSSGSVPNWASNELFKNAGGFPPPTAQATEERMRNSAPLYPPQEPMRTSGSIPNWASNEPFKNASGFPPPTAQATQERMRNSAPLYPQEPMRTSGSVPNWASNEPFKNVGGFPPPSAQATQERMRNSAPQEPMRISGSVPNWASNEPGGFPPPSAQKAQEQMRNSAPLYPPQEPMRTSGSVPNWPSNEPFKNVGGFPPPSAQTTQERMRNSAPLYPPQEPMRNLAPQEPMRTSGSVPNWASNEPGGFPPHSAQNTQERMRNSTPLYPPQEPMRTSVGSGFQRAPNSQEMLRNSAGSSGLRPPDPYRHLGNPAGPAPSRAPFPPPLNSAPRPSPPTFPKDEVTAKFFDSLKDMDIAEVTATLNKITTTNPAFRGIHVPSLVRYLMDTGKIRSSGNRPGNV